MPDFVGERYYSKQARLVAVICAIFVSFTYIAGQMRGVGVVFSRFLDVEIGLGVLIGMGIVFIYAVMGGMKGITYTQVAQYCVLIFAFLVPAIFISLAVTGHVFPQWGFGSTVLHETGADSGVYLLDKLDKLHQELGFSAYTSGTKGTIDVLFITAALMVGTAGLPHVIIRFFTVPRVRDARLSAGYALLFIARALYDRSGGGCVCTHQSHRNGPRNSLRRLASMVSQLGKDGASGLGGQERRRKDPVCPGRRLRPAARAEETSIGENRIEGTLRRAAVCEPPPPAVGTSSTSMRDIMVLANPEIARFAQLGDRAGGSGWAGGCALYRGGTAARHLGRPCPTICSRIS